MDYIATEQEELRTEKVRRSREKARLRGRFGVGLGGLSDDEALRYAEMMSTETFRKDEERRASDAGYQADTGESSSAAWSSTTVTPEGSMKGHVTASSPKYKTDDEFDHNLEEALRLSLMDGVDEGGRSPEAPGAREYEFPIRYKEKRSRRSPSSSPSTSPASKDRVKTKSPAGADIDGVEAIELDFALQLRLAMEQSRMDNSGVEEDEFPALESRVVGKGKARAE